MTKSIRAAGRFGLLVLSPLLVSLQACTDLDESPSSAVTPETFYQNEQEVLGGLAAVYVVLRTTLPGSGGAGDGAYFNVSEVSSDEMIVPTRGSDWFDNGRWLELHRQLWSPTSPSGASDINRVWLTGFAGIARANVMIDALQGVALADSFEAVVTAELRTLRAFYYYILMDMFGGVPIVTETEIKPRPKNTRAEVFAFIETELNAARAALPTTWPAASHGRMTKGAADAILASMYLNAGVFARDNVSATAYNSCTQVQVGGQSACQAAITAADRILNSSAGYMLEPDWRSNFRHNNHLSRENILVVKHLNADGLGFRFLQASLHYNQFNPAPWNGFATIAETYNAFDPDDQRRQTFLAGPQVNLETGAPVCERPGCPQGKPLVFTPEIRDATQATEGEGVRFAKFPPDPAHVGPDNGNDFPFFRLAEIHLIKAEAEFELGTGNPLALLNALRARVFEPDEPLTTVDRDVILRERLFELASEAKRRQDLIRHGRFTRPWAFKDQREAHRILMPIPQSQLDANPLLTQNPGYN